MHLGCQELRQTGSIPLLHLKKFTPNSRIQFPPNCGGTNGDGTSLFWNLEVHGKERSRCVPRKIGHDLAATYSEVIDDPHTGMVALERSREFDLIAEVLPLFSHISTNNKSSVCKEASGMRLPRTLPSPHERLVGEWTDVKEIEIFRSCGRY